jgi:hypothetical protein
MQQAVLLSWGWGAGTRKVDTVWRSLGLGLEARELMDGSVMEI